MLCSSHVFEPSQLGGFVVTVSDWHARLCLHTCACNHTASLAVEMTLVCYLLR